MKRHLFVDRVEIDMRIALSRHFERARPLAAPRVAAPVLRALSSTPVARELVHQETAP